MTSRGWTGRQDGCRRWTVGLPTGAGEELGAFRAELNRIHPAEVADRVDHRLLRSALARVEWESEIVRVRSVPRYWVDQAIGPVFDALLRPDVDPPRIAEVVRLLRAVPATLSHAPAALSQAAREFAALAVGELDGIDARVAACAQALALVDPGAAADLRSAAAWPAPRCSASAVSWRRQSAACRLPGRSGGGGMSGSCARSPASP